MNTDRYDELVSLCLDGEPDAAQLDELAGMLADKPQLAEDFRKQLILWEAWSQDNAAERSAESFMAGLKTRMRAETDAPEFGQVVAKRLTPRRKVIALRSFLAAAASLTILIAMMLLPRQTEGRQVRIHGECVCTRCTLGQTPNCSKAIRYVKKCGTPDILPVHCNPSNAIPFRYFCGGPTPVTVEGDMSCDTDSRALEVCTYEFDQ